MKHTLAAAAVFIATLSSALADGTAKCGPSSPCPKDAPCCSQYGECGVGAYCLGGCDPTSSFSMQSCMAAPVCKSSNYQLKSLDDIAPNTVYLGDSSKANWVSSGKPAAYNGDSVLLTMAPSTVGTLLTSTRYVWYGKISATMSTSQGQGVVTAFILMSDVKDEIDFEFVGKDTLSAQSNYYWQGVTDYNNMVPLNTTDTRQNTHTYTIDWQPDQLTWSIDGKVMRTLKKSDTWNATNNAYHYPQTPSRVQLSLWPAGLDKNGEGTVTWSGGLVNWDSPYMQNGYYYAVVKEVDVQCYDPPSGFSNNFGSKAYYYENKIGTNNTVAIGNNNTMLSSFYATGDNPTLDPNAKPSGSSSATASSASMSATPQTVPGISGTGAMSAQGAPADSSDPSSNSGSNSNSGSGSGTGSAPSSQSSSSLSGFSQGSTSKSGADKIATGSAIALLGFFCAALAL